MEAPDAHNRYETFLESTSDLIYVLDANGKYQYVNRQVVQLLGYGATELKQITCWDIVPEEFREEAKQYFIDRIKKQEKSIQHELPIRSSDNKLVWLRQTVDFEFDENGIARKAYVVATDITDIKEAIEEQDNLVAVIAHDLKSPLNQIFGLSELLKSELEGEAAVFNDMIQKISIEARKMIENLVYLKSYEKHGFKPILQTLNIERFYHLKIKGFSALAAEKKIEITGNCTALHHKIKMDESALGRIIDNLMSNAIKFSREGTSVQFDMVSGQDKLELHIKDQGPGFTQDDRKKLYRKFEKLSARPTGGEKSSGLGLSIVHTLVEGLRGKIELSSQPGQGATFKVKIPLQPGMTENNLK